MNSTAVMREQEMHAGLALLGRSIAGEQHYTPEVEGALPAGLNGTLYRNGPGLFERGDVRKRHVLDGDGLVQALRLSDSTAEYRCRFVRTEKFVAEEAAGKYLYPTWSTLAPGLPTRNIGNRIKPQAGVTVVARNGRLFAFDDTGLPYELDPVGLDTVGEVSAAPEIRLPSYNAHSRIDAGNGDWIQFGLTHGRHTSIHVSVKDRDDAGKHRYIIDAGRATYIHDFFVTKRYVVFLLHALAFNPLAMLLGYKSVIDSFEWRPGMGNVVLVADRDTGAVVAKADAPPSFMWHALNAYERGGDIIADFVGYDEPDHFIGDDPESSAIMNGRSGAATHAGKVRRYVIGVGSGSLREEIIADGYHEFPMINPARYCHAHRWGYFTRGFRAETNFHSGYARIDMDSGATELFDFGPGFYTGEPVFVPMLDGDTATGDGRDAGWLLSEVLDGHAGRSFVAVLRADALGDGPIAKIWLNHHVPLSFHGWWSAG